MKRQLEKLLGRLSSRRPRDGRQPKSVTAGGPSSSGAGARLSPPGGQVPRLAQSVPLETGDLDWSASSDSDVEDSGLGSGSPSDQDAAVGSATPPAVTAFNPFDAPTQGGSVRINFPDFDAAMRPRGSGSSDLSGTTIGTLARERPVAISVSSGVKEGVDSEQEAKFQEECQLFFDEHESSCGGEERGPVTDFSVGTRLDTTINTTQSTEDNSEPNMMALYQQIHQQMQGSDDMSLSIENKRYSRNDFPDVPKQLAGLSLQIVSVAAQTDIDSEVWQRIWKENEAAQHVMGRNDEEQATSLSGQDSAKKSSGRMSDAAVQTEWPTYAQPPPQSAPSTSQTFRGTLNHPHSSAAASGSQTTQTYAATRWRSDERETSGQALPSHGTSRHQPHPPKAVQPPVAFGMHGRKSLRDRSKDAHRQRSPLPRYCVYCGEPLVREVMARMTHGARDRQHPPSSEPLCSSCPTSSDTSSERLKSSAGPTPMPFHFGSSLFDSTIGTRSTANLSNFSVGIHAQQGGTLLRKHMLSDSNMIPQKLFPPSSGGPLPKVTREKLKSSRVGRAALASIDPNARVGHIPLTMFPPGYHVQPHAASSPHGARRYVPYPMPSHASSSTLRRWDQASLAGWLPSHTGMTWKPSDIPNDDHLTPMMAYGPLRRSPSRRLPR